MYITYIHQGLYRGEEHFNGELLKHSVRVHELPKKILKRRRVTQRTTRIKDGGLSDVTRPIRALGGHWSDKNKRTDAANRERGSYCRDNQAHAHCPTASRNSQGHRWMTSLPGSRTFGGHQKSICRSAEVIGEVRGWSPWQRVDQWSRRENCPPFWMIDR